MQHDELKHYKNRVHAWSELKIDYHHGIPLQDGGVLQLPVSWQVTVADPDNW